MDLATKELDNSRNKRNDHGQVPQVSEPMQTNAEESSTNGEITIDPATREFKNSRNEKTEHDLTIPAMFQDHLKWGALKIRASLKPWRIPILELIRKLKYLL